MNYNSEYLHENESVTCEECGECVNEYYIMKDTLATDDIRSNGRRSKEYNESKTLCVECSFQLFESSGGRWQAS